MNFITSINTCFKKYADFRGRAGRPEFWYFALFYSLILLCADIIDARLAGETYWSYDGFFGPVSAIINILTILPSVAVSIRRLHDINKSGWWYLIGLTIVGILPLIYWFARESDRGPNNFGNSTVEILDEKDIFKLPRWIKFFLIPFVYFTLLILVVFGILLKTGYIPSTEVLSGNDIHERQKKLLISNNIIDKDEKILHFYSDALFSIMDSGQLITKTRLIRYQKDENQILEIADMKLSHIRDVELQGDFSTFSDNVYKITGNYQSQYAYIVIILPTQDDGDKKFIEEIKKNIEEKSLLKRLEKLLKIKKQ